MTKYYPATFLPHNDGTGRYDVIFHDFPGCVSQGDNLEDALTMAEEALSLHHWGMQTDGDLIPTASTIEEAKRADEAEAKKDNEPLPEHTLYNYVAVRPLKDNIIKDDPTKTVTVSFKISVLERIDSTAKDLGLTRSGLINVATREYVQKMG